MHRANIVALATALLLVSVGIIWKQRQAKSCPAHNRYAGTTALAVAAASAIASAALLIYSTRIGP